MTKTQEQWRRSPSLPEYLVSSWGRVMRVPYWGEMPYGGERPYGGQPHYGQDTGEGRMIFVFKNRSYRVHRIVCEAFNGPPLKGSVCIHIDENYKNNRPENLKWGTQKENLNAPGFIAYCHSRTGENSPTRKGRAKKWS